MKVNLITRAQNVLLVEFDSATAFTIFYKQMERVSRELVELRGQDGTRIFVRPSDVEVVEL